MLKPHHVLLYLISAMFPLWLLLFLFPENGIALPGGEIVLKFPTAKEFFNNEKPQYANINALIDEVNVSDDVEELPKPEAMQDTLPKTKTLIPVVEKFDIQELKTQALDFPEGKSDLLYSLFSSMRYARQQGQTVSIMHYGDSQLEGDRITDYVRNKLQLQFGGGGAGLIPAMPLYKMPTVKHESTGPWKRYTLFGQKDTTVHHRRYGMMHAISRFSPYINDSLPVDTQVYSAEIRIEKPKHGLKTAKKVNELEIFYGYGRSAVALEVHADGELIQKDSLKKGATANIFKISMPGHATGVVLKFSGHESPDFYGITFTNDSGGVAWHNIAMRGSSGTMFTGSDAALLGKQYHQLNVKLLILQFGGNVMPYMRDSTQVHHYARSIRRQIKYLQRVAPDIPIIFIGPSDMSVKEDEFYVTYPMLDFVNESLRQAALSEGAAYWNMYKAMGGHNSMPRWVEANLAGKDYVHFSPKGARIIAEMFYEAFIHEYQKYANAMAETL